MEISSNILSSEGDVDRNFQRHFEVRKVMSKEISNDALELLKGEIGENFYRHYTYTATFLLTFSSLKQVFNVNTFSMSIFQFLYNVEKIKVLEQNLHIIF